MGSRNREYKDKDINCHLYVRAKGLAGNLSEFIDLLGNVIWRGKSKGNHPKIYCFGLKYTPFLSEREEIQKYLDEKFGKRNPGELKPYELQIISRPLKPRTGSSSLSYKSAKPQTLPRETKRGSRPR